jgi:glycosyltransferase involved in cell wall biosynthesis
LRVAHVTPAFHPATAYGGPTESAYQLSRGLAHEGAEVRVLTTDADGLDRVLDIDTRRELALSPGLCARYCHRIAVQAVSPALLRALGPLVRWAEVVHLNAVYNFTTFPTLLAAKTLDRPVIWSTRGALQRWKDVRRPAAKDAWEAACRAIAPRRLVLHCTSEEERRESAGRFPEAEVAVIPNGVPLPETLPPHPPSETLRLLFLGRLHPIKGIDHLIRACGALATRRVGFSLVIAGEGEASYAEHLRALVREHGLDARVSFAGSVRGEAKARLFGEADLLVAPSHSENFGIVIAEALAHALPVIAARGTPWRGLDEQGAGLWVDNDPESLSRAVEAAAALPLREMGLRGRAWVARDFGWDRVAKDMMAVYERTLRTSA